MPAEDSVNRPLGALTCGLVGISAFHCVLFLSLGLMLLAANVLLEELSHRNCGSRTDDAPFAHPALVEE